MGAGACVHGGRVSGVVAGVMLGCPNVGGGCGREVGDDPDMRGLHVSGSWRERGAGWPGWLGWLGAAGPAWLAGSLGSLFLSFSFLFSVFPVFFI